MRPPVSDLAAVNMAKLMEIRKKASAANETNPNGLVATGVCYSFASSQPKVADFLVAQA